MSQKRLFWRFSVWGLLGLLVLLVLWWFFQGKSYGTVTVKPLPEAPETVSAPVATSRYEGRYVTFRYPVTFHVAAPAETKNPLLESFFGVEQDATNGERLALLVTALPTRNLADLPSFAFRASRPESYAQEKITRQGLQASLFTKSEPMHEVGAFFESEGRGVSLVLSSPLGLEGLRQTLLEILDTFEWKNVP